MRTDIDSKSSSKMKDRGLHRSLKQSSRYGSSDDDESDEGNSRRHRKSTKLPRSYERSRKGFSKDSDESSNSDGSCDSKNKKEARRVKDEFRKGKYDSRSENSRRNEGNFNVRIKQEPSSDIESSNRNTNRYKYDSSRIKTENPRRSRWDGSPSRNEDGSPTSRKRFRDSDKEPRWGKPDEEGPASSKKKPLVNVAKPDFGLSGKLAEETNTYNGVVIKYSEPPEARKPKRRWRLYPFKGDSGLPTLYIHRQSAYLIGRDRKVADLPIDHPSCSKQHAALQYRLVPFDRNDGTAGKKISLYIIDLESANGTFVNNNKIEPRKYVQLFEKDVIKFAFSSREYVLLHEHSKDSDEDDNM